MPGNTSYHWFFRYKLHHLPFWFVYHCTWWFLITGSLTDVAHNILFTPYSIKFLFYVVFQAVGVYFNLYFLMPRFLEKGRYAQYISLLVLTIVCMALFINFGYYASAWLSGRSLRELYGVDPDKYLHFFKVNTLPSTTASMTLGMSVKLTKQWIQIRRRHQLLEKEKLETELKFLRSQFNPHFLFNTINSIFVLIHKNPDMASESLAKFSDLLRYQLYECNEQQIPLAKELTYLENFIELERLRQEHNIQLTMQVESSHAGNLVIAPFILIPFIENAFKHVSKGRDERNWIHMHCRLNGQQLCMDIANSISGQHTATAGILHARGIGLANVQRRLDLIYPGKHELTIAQEEKQFRVSLRIDLQEAAVAEPMAVTMQQGMVLNQA